MTLALKIVMASVLFCALIGVVLATSKKKAVTMIVLLANGLFVTAALVYAYMEYAAYQKRMERYGLHEQSVVEIVENNSSPENKYAGFKYFQDYRNALSGYEVFLLEIGLNGRDQFSYQNTIRDEIMRHMENEEYSENYWNTIFTIAFDYDVSTKTYQRSNYSALYVVPAVYEHPDLDEDYGDLGDAGNYSFFERACQLLYISQKAKTVDRSAENITDLWKQNKAYVFTFFSKSKYDELCKRMVDDLIEIHDTITSTLNYEEFYGMYDVSDEVFLDFPSVEYTSSFEYSWPFSFWDRRFAENNASEVYAILKEIQDHYKD
ncbi:hypothetical protein [Flagellimonas olearia]|uniref:Uncharacterized protein n=1 Tax=Flagellimonas olearia TaxID=552546 RepID=A0A444VR51_9FLAO|nr:hypothetical protein [Allomuricauda olearia]RYC53142.1 hypothetical protein DN53_02685 [Allomuricauda olearia]